MASELIPISDEQAKLGQEIVKALRGLGAFVEKALGSTPEDLIGYLGGDWLRYRRAENIARLMQRTKERLAERGIDDTKPASLSLALPILRGAADEDREELADLWARLLAAAMDPATRNAVRHAFATAVRELDPSDARLLQHIHTVGVTRIRLGDGGDRNNTSIEVIAQLLAVRGDEVEVSVRHLEELHFLITAANDKNIWFPSARLREFMRACYPEIDVD